MDQHRLHDLAELPKPKQGRMPTEKYMLDTLNGVIQQLNGILDLSCIMLVKIAKMIVTAITTFPDLEQTGHPWTRFFKGVNGLCWNLLKAPSRQVLMGLYARIIFLPAHYMVTFEEAFYTRFFEVQSNIFSLLNTDPRRRYIAFMKMETKMPLKDVVAHLEMQERITRFKKALEHENLRQSGLIPRRGSSGA